MSLFRLGVIPDENRRELTFLREQLGIDKYLKLRWELWNDGLGEDRYPSSHRAGWPYRAQEKITPANVTKLEVKQQAKAKP